MNKKRHRSDEDAEIHVPSTHCCRCHMETIEKVMASIHIEYKKTITALEVRNDSLQKSLRSKKKEVERLNEENKTMSNNCSRDLEIKHNKILTLQRIIKEIRNDIKRGKEPQEPSPIETEVCLGFLIETSH